MMKDERIRARRLATLAAACAVLATRAAAAQDPPPPMVPSEAPDAPPPPPAPDAVPRPAPPSVSPPPPSMAPPPDSAPVAPPEPTEPPAPVEPPVQRESKRAGSAHVLKGHTFVPGSLIDSAFVETHLGLGVELGHQWASGVNFNDPSSTTSYTRSLGVTTEHLSTGLALSERVELGLDATYASYVDSDVQTAVEYGNQSAWELRPGLRIRAFRSPTSGTQIGLHLYGDFSGGSRQNPLGVLGEVATEFAANPTPTQAACLGAGDLSCSFTNGAYNPATASQYNTRQLGGGATVNLAQAFSSLFGVQAAAGLEIAGASAYGPGSTVGSTNTVGSVVVTAHAGLAASFDFGPTVPLVFMGEYRFTFVNETTAETAGTTTTMGLDAGVAQVFTHSLAGGLYYTGRRDLILGAVLNASFTTSGINYDDTTTGDVASVANPPVTTLSGQIAATYFF